MTTAQLEGFRHQAGYALAPSVQQGYQIGAAAAEQLHGHRALGGAVLELGKRFGNIEEQLVRRLELAGAVAHLDAQGFEGCGLFLAAPTGFHSGLVQLGQAGFQLGNFHPRLAGRVLQG
jgi:hypothetical protein